jgi:hypothetical protein
LQNKVSIGDRINPKAVADQHPHGIRNFKNAFFSHFSHEKELYPCHQLYTFASTLSNGVCFSGCRNNHVITSSQKQKGKIKRRLVVQPFALYFSLKALTAKGFSVSSRFLVNRDARVNHSPIAICLYSQFRALSSCTGMKGPLAPPLSVMFIPVRSLEIV